MQQFRMRIAAGFLIAVVLWCASAAGQGQQAPRIVSPEIAQDRHVTFRLYAPQAHDVVLTGELMQGPTNLQKAADGVWSVTIGPIEPEIYFYNFIIDGVRTIDPSNPNVKTGSTASTITSAIEIHGENPAFYDGQDVAHGDIRTHWYPSKSLNSLRRMTVYTPPGYDKDVKASYPVLYLFHGANADETAWVRLGRVNLILDNLLAAAKAKPFIVVMPFGYGVDPNGQNQKENTAQFSKDLIDDVIPFIQSRYRTLTDRDHRAIVGLSMGGGESLSIGLNHLELFSYVGGFSSALGTAAELPKTYAGLVADPENANRKLRLLWFGCGTEDSLFRASKGFSDFLTTNKIRHTFHPSSGAHTWMVWRRYLNQLAPMLF